MAGNGGRRNYSPRQTSRWRMCFGSFSCFGPSKRKKNRIVPHSRSTQSSPPSNCHSNHPPSSQTLILSLTPSLLAPPSSPSSSFSHSTISSASLEEHPCFVAGPYAGETQLFSPPVFSTEPSTAPLTSPSSPDVPLSQFLSFLSHRSVSLSRSSSAGGWEAAYRASFGFSADELPAEIGEYIDECSSFTMSPFVCAEASITDFLQPEGMKHQSHAERRDSYYPSLSDAEVEYQRTRSWGEERCIFLHSYC